MSIKRINWLYVSSVQFSKIICRSLATLIYYIKAIESCQQLFLFFSLLSRSDKDYYIIEIYSLYAYIPILNNLYLYFSVLLHFTMFFIYRYTWYSSLLNYLFNTIYLLNYILTIPLIKKVLSN